jgi:hypothetical protein
VPAAVIAIQPICVRCDLTLVAAFAYEPTLVYDAMRVYCILQWDIN